VEYHSFSDPATPQRRHGSAEGTQSIHSTDACPYLHTPAPICTERRTRSPGQVNRETERQRDREREREREKSGNTFQSDRVFESSRECTSETLFQTRDGSEEQQKESRAREFHHKRIQANNCLPGGGLMNFFALQPQNLGHARTAEIHIQHTHLRTHVREGDHTAREVSSKRFEFERL
jgi:hypothetical protein